MVDVSVSVKEQIRSMRRMRRPMHPFAVASQPWRITPSMIAPVLPGDTLKEAMLRCRCITDPVISRHGGMWFENYLFYVRAHTLGTNTEALFLDPTHTLSGLDIEAGDDTYDLWMWEVGKSAHANGSVDAGWLRAAYRQIVTEWFRDEGEDHTDHVDATSGLAFAKVRGLSRNMDSLVNWSDVDDELHEVDVDADSDGTITVEEINRAVATWQDLNARGLVNMTMEEYIEQYGVKVRPTIEDETPELLRRMSEWEYPISAIDPTDGSAVSAVSFTVNETLNAPKRFQKPGFIIGIMVLRPWVMIEGQLGSFSQLMTSTFDWLPAGLMDNATISLKKRLGKTTLSPNKSDPPYHNYTDDYQIDMRDYWLYGEQFVSGSLASSAGWIPSVALPTAAGEKQYASDEDGYSLFVGGDGADIYRAQGFYQLDIASPITDMTPFMKSS